MSSFISWQIWYDNLLPEDFYPYPSSQREEKEECDEVFITIYENGDRHNNPQKT